MGRGRRIEQWQQLGPPFSIRPPPDAVKRSVRTKVARRFRGESLHKVDGKGRVSVPASFRRVLEAGDPDWTKGLRPQFVIHYGSERQKYLEVYTMLAIDDVDRRIEALPRGSARRRVLEEEFQGKSLPSEVDGDGRLILPQKLRDKLGLEDEAFFIGSGDTFKIWKPETYEQVGRARIKAFLEQQPEDFDVLSLLDPSEGP